VEGAINVTYPVLDEHGYAVAALTVPYLRRMGDNHRHGDRTPNLETSEFSAFPRDWGESRESARNWTLKPDKSHQLWPIHKCSPQRAYQ